MNIRKVADNYALSVCSMGIVNSQSCLQDAFICGFDYAKTHMWNDASSLPREQHPVIIECEHGAVFNGMYSYGKWYQMDGYKVDNCGKVPVYSSFVEIPKEWKPIRWTNILHL